MNYAAFGLVMILFLVFEPQGLVGIWRRVQDWFLLWPFKQQPLAAVMSEPLLKLDKRGGHVPPRHHRRARRVARGAARRVVALLGTNGAGKTTTLRAISGFIGLDDAARHRRRDHATRASASRTGRRTTSPRAASRWSPSAARCSRTSRSTRTSKPRCRGAAPIAAGSPSGLRVLPGARRAARRDAGYLSGGERQMLGDRHGADVRAGLLLVDELSQGLAPLSSRSSCGGCRRSAATSA